MKKKLQIGIIGAGKAGTNLAVGFSQNPRAEIKWVVSRTKESAARLAKKCKAEIYGNKCDEMLQDKKIDAVVVASPDKFHHEQVIKAAAAGKHILCEKPMCATIDEAEAMISAAEKSGVILMIGFIERFNQPCIEAKRRLAIGEIGNPVMILARRCHPRSILRGRSWLNDRETGGVLNYVGTHNIDLICDFMGQNPERVHAEMARLVIEGREFTDCAVMTFKFPGGKIAALYETFAYPSKYPHGVDRSIEILGTCGVMKIDFMNQPLSVYADDLHSIADSSTWPELGGKIGGAILNEVEHFISCICDGTEVLTPGWTGLRAVRIVNAAKLAAEKGHTVNV